MRCALADPWPLADAVVGLRPWRPADAGALAAAWGDPVLMATTAVPDERSEAAAGHWIAGWDERRRRGAALDLVVHAAATPSVVLGEVGINFVGRPRGRPTMGWWLMEGSRGQGLASRALALFVPFVLALPTVDAVDAEIAETNASSRRLAERRGFRRVAPGLWTLDRPEEPALS